MGRLNEMGKRTLISVLAYGPSQTKKTWWAGAAAEAGFNVIYIDGDGHLQTLRNLSPEAQSRIHVFSVVDGFKKPYMAEFTTRLLRTGKILWDDVEGRIVKRPENDSHLHIGLDLTQLDANWVVVIDSWTALSWSLLLRFCLENNIDLSEAEEPENKRGMYGYMGQILDWHVEKLTSIPCHLIVIGHADAYDKIRTEEKFGKKKEILLFSRTQIKSSSRPHAMKMPKNFDEVAQFFLQGNRVKIDTRPHEDADGGSRSNPMLANWEDLQFIDIIKASGAALPNPDVAKTCEGVVYYDPEPQAEQGRGEQEQTEVQTESATNVVPGNATRLKLATVQTKSATVSASTTGKAKPKGLMALAAKKGIAK